MKNGSVQVQFYGYHNHDCQDHYAVNFVNPLAECSQLSHMVDVKLLAGMTDYKRIMDSIINESIDVGRVEGRVNDNLERFTHDT